MKYACYCMTRNYYPKTMPSVNSLLANSDVNRVFLLTEDDDVGFEVPDRVRVVNVRNQTYFPKDGANYNCHWTHMSLMRTALAKVFPEADRILSLDSDTIVDADISELWNAPIENHYLAGVPEVSKSTDAHPYVNAGVVLWNLKKVREDGKDDEMIRELNQTYYPFPDQDVMNKVCRRKIYKLNSCYNFSNYSAPTRNPKIYHFAATAGWFERHPLVQKYTDRI